MQEKWRGAAAAVLLLLPVMGQAATVGAWTFDTAGAVDGSYATGPGSILDSSGEANHLTPRPGGVVLPGEYPVYRSDRPAVLGDGLSLRVTRSENYVVGQQRLEISAADQSAAMDLGSTFTLEGWAKLMDAQNNTFIQKVSPMTEIALVLNQNAMSLSLSDLATTSSYYTADAVSNPSGSAIPWTDAGAAWHHYAVTVDLVANSLRMYRDGVEYAATRRSGSTINLLLNDVDAAGHLSIGGEEAGIAGTSNAFYDEVRISNSVLLPGGGTGIGELAWGSSIVPEPAGVAWAACAGLVAVGRRRKRSGLKCVSGEGAVKAGEPHL